MGKIARITNDGKLLIKGEVIEKDKEVGKISQLMPNGDLIIYGELVEKVVPLPPEDEIWIYGRFTTTYEIGQLLGDWGSNSIVVDFYYDDDHYVIKASGTNLGETFCRVFNTNGNTVIFGSSFSLRHAFQQASKATFIILNNTLAIRTQNHYMQAKKIYVPDNLVETYKAQTSAMALIGEVLPLSNYTTVMPRILPDGTLLVGELIERGIVYLAQDDDFVKVGSRWVYRGSELEIEIPHIIQGEEVTSYDYMFNGSGSYLATPVTRVVSNNKMVTSMSFMFSESSATTLDLSNFDTSKVASMSNMFYNCSSLTSLDLRSFDTSNVTNMVGMFRNCSSLTSLDVSSFDTSKVASMIGTFRNCSSLTSLDVNSFDTSKVASMSNMFDGCRSLTSLDLSSFDTANVTNLGNMFNGCRSITTAYARTQEDIDKFNTSSNMPSNLIFIVKGV